MRTKNSSVACAVPSSFSYFCVVHYVHCLTKEDVMEAMVTEDTQKNGYDIAREQGQIYRPDGTHNPDVLYSECLY